MDHQPTRNPLASHLAAAALAALLVTACGGGGDADGGGGDADGDGGSAATTTDAPAEAADDPAADTTTTVADDGGSGGEAEFGFGCDRLDPDAVADVIGSVQGSGDFGSPTDGTIFGRADGTAFTYFLQGCRYVVEVPGDEDGHEVRVGVAPNPDGIDIFGEYQAERDAEDIRPVDGIGDAAMVDDTFGDGERTLLVRVGDGVVLVRSKPPFGTQVLGDDELVALAALAIPTLVDETG